MQELRIREICALLWDYKQTHLKVLEATTLSALGQALEERRKAGDRRFCHMQVRIHTLRMQCSRISWTIAFRVLLARGISFQGRKQRLLPD